MSIHCGLDVHSKTTTVYWLDDETGEEGRPCTVPNDELAAHLQALPEAPQVIMEAGSISRFVKRQLESCQIEAVVVDAHKAHRVLEAVNSQTKTDKADARGLAMLSARGWAEDIKVWVPDTQAHHLRQLTRAREKASGLSNQVRNEIRALLRGEGFQCPAERLTSPKATAWMDEIAQRLDPLTRQILHSFRELLAAIVKQIADFDAMLEEAVAEDKRCQQLTTIIGCSTVTAAAVVAEIGDISRFDDAKALRRYAGLTPRIEQSGERTKIGHLVEQCNKHLRRALILIAQCFAHNKRLEDTRIRRQYYRCLFRHGPNPAKVDAARRLCDIIFAMLRDGTDFDPGRLALA